MFSRHQQQASGASDRMDNFEAIAIRRQVLDWRDKWLYEIPVKLERELPMLLSVLDAKIEEMTFAETFSTEKFAEKHLQPTYESWIQRKSQVIIDRAQSDLKLINEEILEYNAYIHRITQDSSRDNATEIGVAGGAAGAALLGIPAVAAFSTTSAGGVLGLLGMTVISWPVVVGGVVVLGGMMAFGGSKAFGFRDKAVGDYKQKTRDMLRKAVLLSDDGEPSVVSGLQDYIRKTSNAYLQELKRVQQHSV